MREDGRPAALERASRTQDHPVAAEQIEKDPVRHIAESYSGIGALVRSLSTTSASALVPQIWSSSIIDIARRQAQVINAGAEVVPMDGKTLNIGRALTDPPSAWVAEGGTRTAADPSYDLITLTTSTMYCFTTVTLEWLADAPNADSILEEQIGKSMALELDLSALFGGAITGVDGVAAAALGAQASPPGPRGILGDLLANYPAGVLGNATNGTVQVVAGYWREVLQAYYLTRANNESPTALIWPSKLAAQYAGLVDTLGQPLRRPDALAQLQFLESQQIPANLTQGTGTNMADFVLGDFRQVILGQRLSMTLQVLTERYAEAGMIGLLMTYRGDIRLARPKAMAWWRFLQGVA
jgi:HK97 family phage major capsid protein